MDPSSPMPYPLQPDRTAWARKSSLEFTTSLQAQAAVAKAEFNNNLRNKFRLFPVTSQVDKENISCRERNDAESSNLDFVEDEKAPIISPNPVRRSNTRSCFLAPSYARHDPYSERVAEWNLQPTEQAKDVEPIAPMPPPLNISRKSSLRFPTPSSPVSLSAVPSHSQTPARRHTTRGTDIRKPHKHVDFDFTPPIPRRSSKRRHVAGQAQHPQRYSLAASLGLTVSPPSSDVDAMDLDRSDSAIGSPNDIRPASPTIPFGTIRIVSPSKSYNAAPPSEPNAHPILSPSPRPQPTTLDKCTPPLSPPLPQSPLFHPIDRVAVPKPILITKLPSPQSPSSQTHKPLPPPPSAVSSSPSSPAATTSIPDLRAPFSDAVKRFLDKAVAKTRYVRDNGVTSSLRKKLSSKSLGSKSGGGGDGTKGGRGGRERRKELENLNINSINSNLNRNNGNNINDSSTEVGALGKKVAWWLLPSPSLSPSPPLLGRKGGKYGVDEDDDGEEDEDEDWHGEGVNEAGRRDGMMTRLACDVEETVPMDAAPLLRSWNWVSGLRG